jgi:tetratricopeptide (TPR) repeat protein
MQESTPLKHEVSGDVIERTLRAITQNITVFLFGLLPLFFIPLSFIPIDYSKIVFVILGIGLVTIFWSLLVLRTGKLMMSAPLVLACFCLISLASVASALLSGDMRDAFLGDDFGVYTALFSVTLACVALILPLVEQTKTSLMRLYILFAVSAVCVALFHITRLLFGVDVLSLGIFASETQSMVGTWNDVALFFGLTILLSLIALEQLPLTRSGQSFFGVVVVLSLAMLAVVNFFAVWIVLGLVSLSLLMYNLTKNRFADKTLTLGLVPQKESVPSLLVSVVVFITSVVFIIGGATVGGALSRYTNISYLEVRPSFEATVDIGRAVYAHDAFVGIGPNKFADAWRLYKDRSINESIFWSTDFTGGNGFIPTAFVTTGLLGAASWVLFFLLFVVTGIRMLLKSTFADRFWYFIGSSSFASALYIWVMAFLYVPGALMLLLGALFTGIFCCAYVALVPTRTFGLSVLTNKRATFVLVGFAMLVIVGTTTGLYYLSKHASSVYTFGKSVTELAQGATLDVAETGIARAYAMYTNELYALQIGAYQLAKINTLAGLPELTQAQQQELQRSIANAVSAGRIVTDADPTDAQGWSLLGAVYSVLASAQVEGAQDRAREVLTKARELDPLNPAHVLREAQLYAAIGEQDTARTKLADAIALKRNYTEALSFLAQLDIAEGKADDAINTTAAIVSFEPNNPARYYQLGVLLSAAGRLDEAIEALTVAVGLDQSYANARYFLALAYAQKGDREAALSQLRLVLELNPGNEVVTDLIAQLERGVPIGPQATASTGTVSDPSAVTNGDGTVTTSEAPQTPLVSPVNTPPKPQTETTN